MNKPHHSEKEDAYTTNWFSIRPVPVFIIAAWSLLPITNLKWQNLTPLLKTGELPIFHFILFILHPVLLLVSAITLLLLKKYSTYLFIVSILIGISNLLIFSGNIVSTIPVNLIIALAVTIYCFWLKHNKILK